MALINLQNNIESANNNCHIIGLDLGYGYVKISSGERNIKFLSIVGNPISNFAKTSAISSLDELLNTLTIIYQGKTYYIGHNAQLNTRNGKISLRQDKYDNDEQTKIKIMTALALFTAEDQYSAEFDVVLGLPVLEYYNQRDKINNMILNNNQPFEFTMKYGNKSVNKSIKCTNCKIISQGEGAYYNYILDSNAEIITTRSNNVAGLVVITDSGFKTCDIVTMENGRYIETYCDQLNSGVVQIHNEILRLIMQNYNIKKELKDIDEIVRNKQVFYSTKTYNIEHLIKQATEPFADNIIESLYTIHNGELGNISRILLTGGGAELTFEYIKEKLKNTVQVEKIYNSEFANAQGYYKYGKFLKNNNMF